RGRGCWGRSGSGRAHRFRRRGARSGPSGASSQTPPDASRLEAPTTEKSSERTRCSDAVARRPTGEHPEGEGGRVEDVPGPTRAESHREAEGGDGEVIDVKHYAYRVVWSAEDD